MGSNRFTAVASVARGRRTRVVNSQPFAYFGDHRLFVGKLAGLKFGIHQLVVDRQFKTPAAGRLQLHALKTLFVLAENLGRQTDGLRLVVSSRAITQMDFHVCRSPIYRGCFRIPDYLALPEADLFFGAFFFEGGADFFGRASWPSPTPWAQKPVPNCWCTFSSHQSG